LRYCEFSDGGAKILAEIIPNAKKLKILYLGTFERMNFK